MLKEKHASELAAARMKPGMVVSAPWAEQTLLWSSQVAAYLIGLCPGCPAADLVWGSPGCM